MSNLATANSFAALSKKKKSSGSGSSKDKAGSSKSSKGKKETTKAVSSAELEKAIFSQPSINISSWADEEDDDYSVPVLPPNWETVGASCGALRPAGGDLRASGGRI
jgi:hypothetical protein